MKKRNVVLEQFLAIIYIQIEIYGFSHSLFDYYTFIQLLEQLLTVLNAIIYNILPVSLKLYHIFQAHEPPMKF